MASTYHFNEDEMTVTLTLPEGEITCDIVTILTVDENDYIALLPLDEEGYNSEGNTWLYRYFENEEDIEAEPRLEYIFDEDEFNLVSDAFDEFLSHSEYDEIYYDEEA